MKKNDHYFPTVDWIKDPNEPIGWKRITYDSGRKDGVASPAADGVEDVTADGPNEHISPLEGGGNAVLAAGGEGEAAPTGT
jgi:pro-apoptotic serine protease NMA111